MAKREQAIAALRFLTPVKVNEETGLYGTFCVKEGTLRKGDALRVTAGSGTAIPAQFQPLAFWPDGSVKWMGVAFVVDGSSRAQRFAVTRGRGPSPKNAVSVRRGQGGVTINTGAMKVRLPGKAGPLLDRLLIRRGTKWIEKVAPEAPVNLFARRCRRRLAGARETAVHERFEGEVEEISVEQKGPIRAVVRLRGRHRLPGKRAAFLRFSVRLYFFAGCRTIRMVHTFFYDGDSDKDFISGLGVEFPIDMDAPACNRHALFGMDERLWREPVNWVTCYGAEVRRGFPLEPNPCYADQLAFKYLESPQGLGATPVWNSYSLRQDSHSHFVIQKATSEDYGPVVAAHGERSRGWGGIVGPAGGVAVGIRDFWQAFPSAIELRDAGREDAPARLRAELWPTSGEPLDLRHYAGEAYPASYESGAGGGKKTFAWSTSARDEWTGNPYGIGRTSELTFHVLDGTEDKAILQSQADVTADPPALVCAPKDYFAAGVFSPWSLPSSKKALQPLERILDELAETCARQTEENQWYGFIDYGDFQMEYVEARGCWRYDDGGHAWANEELMPNLFLWQLFLRTGRADLFRAAEAMSRHGEVDMFHIGPLRGIGTRHNVKHWGCGNHEIRQSMAGAKRYHHLITGDERSREIILEECPDVGRAWIHLEKVRGGHHALPVQDRGGDDPIGDNEVTGTLGPHLSSFFWNWVSIWEFTGDRKSEAMVRRAAEYMATRGQPWGFAGWSMVYRVNFETGELKLITPHAGKPPMANMFGSEEIWLELSRLLKSAAWDEALAKYGELHLIEKYDERFAAAPEATGHGSAITDRNLNYGGINLIAFAGARGGDKAALKRAVERLLRDRPAEVLTSGDNRVYANWGRLAIAVIALVERRL